MPKQSKVRVQQHFPKGEGRTRQSFRDETDINLIVGKYRTTGFVDHVNLQEKVYGDFSSGEDYRESVERVQRANDLFASLPARLRARVDNDPSKLPAFIMDPKNTEELVELGLKNPVEREIPEPEPAVAEDPKETASEPETS